MPYVKKQVLEDVLHVDNMMSNVCFNLKQRDNNPDAKTMHELQTQWDASRSALRQSLKKPGRKETVNVSVPTV